MTDGGENIEMKEQPKPQRELSIDMENRDPTNMNDHLGLRFSEIIAEPTEAHSYDKVWTLSYTIFTHTHDIMYRMIGLICGIPTAFCLGWQFACLQWQYIWCMVPSLRMFEIQLSYTRRVYRAIISTYVAPCFEAAGLIFSRIRVTTTKDENEHRELTVDELKYQKLFNDTNLWCYRILSLICAIPAAIYWGIVFSCISFTHIWCLGPALKACRTNLRCTQTIIAIAVDTFIKPIIDVLARLLSRIHVTHAQGKPKNASDENIHLA